MQDRCLVMDYLLLKDTLSLEKADRAIGPVSFSRWFPVGLSASEKHYDMMYR